MLARSTSFRLPGRLVLIVVALFAGQRPRHAIGVPAPRPMPPSALLFIPKMPTRVQTAHYRRYQIDTLRGSPVFAALRNLKAADLPSLKKQADPAGWLKRNLKAEYLDGTGVLRISLMAGGDREQALLVNAIVQAYFKVEVPQQRQMAERQLEAQQGSLKHLQQCLEQIGFGLANPRTRQGIENDVREMKARVKWLEATLRTPPQLLELAEVPPE